MQEYQCTHMKSLKISYGYYGAYRGFDLVIKNIRYWVPYVNIIDSNVNIF